MGIYVGNSTQLLLNAVVKQNPALGDVTVNQVSWHQLTAVSGGETRIVLRGVRGLGWSGATRLTYNRINVSTLFLNVAPWTISMYSAKSLFDLLPRFNQKYGLNLTAEDFTADIPITGATTQSLTLNLANSRMYYGSRVLTWTKGEMRLEDYYPQRTLTVIEKPVLTLSAFGHDFTPDTTVIEAHDPVIPFSSASPTAVAIVNTLRAATGLDVTLSATPTPGTGIYDLSGYLLSRVGTWSVGEANQVYRKLAVLTPPARTGKQTQTVYLHYDLKQAIPTSSLVPVTVLDGLRI